MTKPVQLTETQEQALDSVYVPTLPLHVEHHPEDRRQCRWHVVDAIGGIVEAFPTPEQAGNARIRISAYYASTKSRATAEQVSTVWGTLVLCKSRSTAARLHPFAAVIAKVDGGYLVFQSDDDYKSWKAQK